MLNQANHFGWGASLYPSGVFTLWRKNAQKTVGFKEAFVSAFTGLNRGRPLDEVLELRGAEATELYWTQAEELELRRLRRERFETVRAALRLGSSNPVNSEKARRGLRGLTSRGKNLVREAAIGLEERYGKDRLTFWTVTLPHMSDEDYGEVCANWSRLCENLKKKVQYHLRENGLPTHFVMVTEMQEGRWKAHGVPAWHIHAVFVGCHTPGGWVITPELADKLWSEAVQEYCRDGYLWRSASKLERVKKSVGRYLSKYLSKGTSVIEEVEAAWPGCVPSSWYACTKPLRLWVDRNTRKSEAVARWLYQLISDTASDIHGLWSYTIETRAGHTLAVCWMGSLPDPPGYEFRL